MSSSASAELGMEFGASVCSPTQWRCGGVIVNRHLNGLKRAGNQFLGASRDRLSEGDPYRDLLPDRRGGSALLLSDPAGRPGAREGFQGTGLLVVPGVPANSVLCNSPASQGIVRRVIRGTSTFRRRSRACPARGINALLHSSVQYVRPYVPRKKTDRTYSEDLLQAARCAENHAVPVKTVEQQTVQALHRVRTLWQPARVAGINTLHGLVREHGYSIAGAERRMGVMMPTADVFLRAAKL